jgi:hypothetical protein
LTFFFAGAAGSWAAMVAAWPTINATATQMAERRTSIFKKHLMGKREPQATKRKDDDPTSPWTLPTYLL